MDNRIRRYAVSGLFLFVLLSFLWAQIGSFSQANYTKREFKVPMRDGKKLFTAVYSPRDTTRNYPILLTRTPYSVAPYGEDNFPQVLGPSNEAAREGFIFAYQDVRGRMMSEGDFINLTPQNPEKRGPNDVDESTDAYDTIDWLVKNTPNNNGNVGMWGISYPGFYTACGMIDAHPALKAVSPQAPIADWFIGDDFHHNGAFYLPHAFGFLSSFGRPRTKPTMSFEPAFQFPTPDGYDFFLKMGSLAAVNQKYFKNGIPFWNDLMRHGDYDDFWQARNLRPHLNNIRPAVMTVGGWYDAEDLFGALSVYRAVEESSPGAYNILVMGPWYHGAWARADGDTLGNIHFGADTSEFYRKEIEFPFFKHFLMGLGSPDLPEAYVFQTGSNQWRQENRWPPQNAKAIKLHLSANGALAWDADPEDSASAFDEYISDPAKPVPYTSEITTGMTREHMVEDQRFASRRTDVLTYETEVLNRDITIAGPVAPRLSVSTTGTDSDFIVKLIDVYPDNARDPEPNPENVRMGGFQQLVRAEPFRGKYRNSFSKPEPFIPGEIARIEYQMPDIFHTFRKGHRIMVQVQSTWFPLIDRNPQQFVDIYNAKDRDFIKATQRVYRSQLNLFHPSSFLTINVHLDGQKRFHDRSVGREGVYDIAVDAIKEAVRRGFRVTTNTTLFNDADPSSVRAFFDAMMQLGVEGLTISPGYCYEKAPDQKHFLDNSQTTALFTSVLKGRSKKWRFNQSPLFLEYLMGRRHYPCTPWGMPCYSLFGWQKPCYLLQDGYFDTFQELLEKSEWDRYGTGSGNPRCANCMVHSGYEASAVNDTFGSMGGLLRTIRAMMK